MIEAKITCLTGSIRLPDLDLHLTKGMEVYMPQAKARSSKDLQRAWQGKGVDVQYVRRYRKKRSAGPQQPNPVFPAPKGMGFVPAEPAQDEGVLFDPSIIADEVVARINADAVAKDRVRVALAQRLEAMEERITDKVIRAVQAELAKLPPAQPLGPPVPAPAPGVGMISSVDEDVPVFVPSKIRDGGLTASINVKTEQGDGSGLSEAADALRKTRNSAGKNRDTEND